MHRFDFKTIQNVQNIQHNTKQQKWSNYNELHRFDVKKIKTTQNYESDHIIIIASIWRQNHQNFWVRWQNYKSNQITMNCIDLMSKRSKNVELRRTTFKTTQNYEIDQIIMHCNDLKSKRSKKLSYVPKLQKWSNYNELDRFDVKTIKTTQNYKRDQITINLHRFDIKTIKTVELHRKTFKTTQNYESDQITMDCIDLMAKHQNNAKLQTNAIKLRSICIDLTSKDQNDYKCCVSSQNNQKTPKLRIWSNYNELDRFDFKTIQNVQNIQHNTKQQKWSNYNELHRFDVRKNKTTQNYESDHIIIIASIWRQNHQNFWVRWQNYKSNQITMNCIDLMSKRSKMLSYVAQHSKQRKTTKLIKL